MPFLRCSISKILKNPYFQYPRATIPNAVACSYLVSFLNAVSDWFFRFLLPLYIEKYQCTEIKQFNHPRVWECIGNKLQILIEYFTKVADKGIESGNSSPEQTVRY